MAVFAPIPRARLSTAATVNPLLFQSWRIPNFKSCQTVSASPPPRSSQLKSLMYPRFPKCCSAVRRATSGVIPRRMFSAVRKSRWNCHSSAISRWTASPRRSARKRMASFESHSMVPPSGGAQHLANCDGELRPICFLKIQLLEAFARQLVEASTTVVFRNPPFADNPASSLDAVKRRIQCAFLDLEHFFSKLPNPLSDSVTMHRSKRERLQNQHIERALGQFRLLFACQWVSYWLLVERTLVSLEGQGGGLFRF